MPSSIITADPTRSHEERIALADVPPEVVWRALTDAEELARWFPLAARVEGVGGAISLSWGQQGTETVVIEVWEPGPRGLRCRCRVGPGIRRHRPRLGLRAARPPALPDPASRHRSAGCVGLGADVARARGVPCARAGPGWPDSRGLADWPRGGGRVPDRGSRGRVPGAGAGQPTAARFRGHGRELERWSAALRVLRRQRQALDRDLGGRRDIGGSAGGSAAGRHRPAHSCLSASTGSIRAARFAG